MSHKFPRPYTAIVDYTYDTHHVEGESCEHHSGENTYTADYAVTAYPLESRDDLQTLIAENE